MHWCLVGFQRWLKPPAADNGSEHSRNCLKGKYPGTPFIFFIHIYICVCVYNGERRERIKTYVEEQGFPEPVHQHNYSHRRLAFLHQDRKFWGILTIERKARLSIAILSWRCLPCFKYFSPMI